MNYRTKNKIYRKLSRDYLLARRKFKDATHDDYILRGNDNIVGIIGEFIAIQFLDKELGRKSVSRNENPVEKGFDVIADDKKVSVKTITAENTSGRTTHVKSPWDEFILVELGRNSKVLRIGYITYKQFERFKISQKKRRGWFPVASRSMFDGDGLFSGQGRIFKGADVEGYL